MEMVLMHTVQALQTRRPRQPRSAAQLQSIFLFRGKSK